jgi:hypothetical protein
LHQKGKILTFGNILEQPKTPNMVLTLKSRDLVKSTGIDFKIDFLFQKILDNRVFLN